MNVYRIFFWLSCVCFSSHGAEPELQLSFDQFAQLYEQELGTIQGCQQPQGQQFKVCSSTLRNEGNAPFILHHGQPKDKVVVLFHGLSDSPFYLTSIAQSLHSQGYNVVVALLPGHGKKQADADMQDPLLSDRWRAHVEAVTNIAAPLGTKTIIGGFSTGGALATEYSLLHPNKVSGVLLFSGALALTSSVESLTQVWGIKLLMKWLDGTYQTQGDNPYKYPVVARYAAGELMEVIKSVRQLSEQSPPSFPIWAAHSEADLTTPIRGVEKLLAINTGSSVWFRIGKKFDVCHADLVISESQLAHMPEDNSVTDVSVLCRGSKANPLFESMLESMHAFIHTL
jgi:pimeloyl-ACP methyl ester carboxylesterase